MGPPGALVALPALVVLPALFALAALVAGAAAVGELLVVGELEDDGVGEGVDEEEGDDDGEGDGDGLADADDGSAWHTGLVAAVACGAACAVPSTPRVRKPPLSIVTAATRTCPKRISIACLR